MATTGITLLSRVPGPQHKLSSWLRRFPPPAVVVPARDVFTVAGHAADAVVGVPAKFTGPVAGATVR
jgi:hypothetical protein